MSYRLGISAFAILGAGLLGASQQSPPTLRSNNASRALEQVTNLGELGSEPTFWSHTAVSNIGAGKKNKINAF